MIVRLQPARDEDANLVLAWRNDPDIWRRGRFMRPVTVTEHQQWWTQHAMDATRCRLWLIRVDRVLAGVIRFDRAEPGAVVTIYLVDGFRGRGIGQRAFHQAWTHRPVWAQSMLAEVRLDNPRGQHFFETLGFQHERSRDDRVLLRYRATG